jgi:epoxide hydrolase-like predicted phosphatase
MGKGAQSFLERADFRDICRGNRHVLKKLWLFRRFVECDTIGGRFHYRESNMGNSNPLQALIWDMGGVLVRNMVPLVRARLAEPYGLTGMDLENLFFGNEVARRASIGQGGESDSWEYVRQKLNLQPEAMLEFIRTFWSCDRLDEDLFAFSLTLRPKYKVGLLSNAFPEARVSLGERFPRFYEMFDVSIFSAEVGMAKPDPRIYRIVLGKLGVRAEEAVFVDDFIENVEGARAVGMRAIHFKDPLQVHETLKALFS